jgi:hypothetical protein
VKWFFLDKNPANNLQGMSRSLKIFFNPTDKKKHLQVYTAGLVMPRFTI